MCCKFYCWPNCAKSTLLNEEPLSVMKVSGGPFIVKISLNLLMVASQAVDLISLMNG